MPVARAMGLHVIVTGNGRAKEKFLSMGADRYIDYKKENYWAVLSGIDHVIDTLGAGELNRELSVLKRGGRLLSLRTGPNRRFAVDRGFPLFKRILFTLAGAKIRRSLHGDRERNIVFCPVRARTAGAHKITDDFGGKKPYYA